MPIIPLSPSNLGQYKLCPLKFWGQSIEKTIKWQPTPTKERGITVHATLEEVIQGKPLTYLPDGVDIHYVTGVLSKIQTMRENGAKVLTEHEMSVTKDFKSCGWWDTDCLLRAKADVLILFGDSAVIGDWKTGRIYNDSEFQLRVESLLVHALYKATKIYWSLFYIDQGKTKKGSIDFSTGLSSVMDILNLMKEARQSMQANGPYPAKKNQFCRWCPWYHTDDCAESSSW